MMSCSNVKDDVMAKAHTDLTSLSILFAVNVSKFAICKIFLSLAITVSISLYALSALFRLSIIDFP